MTITTTTVDVTGSCNFELTEWETITPTLELVYTEYSSDNWHQDRTTIVEIDVDKAKEIIELFTKFINKYQEN